MRRSVAPRLVGGLVVAVCACRPTPAPLGEALIVVQTDVDVPRRVNHLTIEVLGASGALTDAREIITLSREDWPVSFSVVLPDGSGPADVTLRLRAYLEGHVLSARDIERFAQEKPRSNITVYETIGDACKNAPKLTLGVPLTLRRGASPITSLLQTQGCTFSTQSGSAVARLDVASAGDYQVAITRGVPDSQSGQPGSDTALSLRSSCSFATTQIACAGPPGGADHLSQLPPMTLAPGTYWVVTGGADPAPADLTLLATRVGAPPVAAAAPVTGSQADAITLQPEPGVTIDRLVSVHLTPGSRGKVEVTLQGECFGTPADLVGGASCVDTAGQIVSLQPEIPRGVLTRDFPEPPPWPGDQPAPCTAAPSKDEVCVAGGAFLLGDTLALQALDRRSQPERMRVVEPFLLDRTEMSVATFRAAVARGFRPPDATPLVNPLTAFDATKPAGVCTYSATPVGRESFPLTCTSWVTARALCRFLGGDLPTEDQWEYAATAAARTAETPYPWGNELPSCTRTVFGRTTLATSACPQSPFGPVAVDDPALVAGDVTSLGIVGLGGNVEELLATPFIAYDDPAWTAAGLRKPLDEANAPLHAARGADWSVGSLFATASTRRSEPVIAAFSNVGFRCARKGR